MQTKVTTAERTAGAIKVNIEALKDGKQDSVSLDVQRNLLWNVTLNASETDYKRQVALYCNDLVRQVALQCNY